MLSFLYRHLKSMSYIPVREQKETKSNKKGLKETLNSHRIATFYGCFLLVF